MVLDGKRGGRKVECGNENHFMQQRYVFIYIQTSFKKGSCRLEVKFAVTGLMHSKKVAGQLKPYSSAGMYLPMRGEASIHVYFF